MTEDDRKHPEGGCEVDGNPVGADPSGQPYRLCPECAYDWTCSPENKARDCAIRVDGGRGLSNGHVALEHFITRRQAELRNGAPHGHG